MPTLLKFAARIGKYLVIEQGHYVSRFEQELQSFQGSDFDLLYRNTFRCKDTPKSTVENWFSHIYTAPVTGNLRLCPTYNSKSSARMKIAWQSWLHIFT